MSSSSRCRKPRPNPFIIGDAILPQTGTKLTEKRGSKFGAVVAPSVAIEKNRNIAHNYNPSCIQLLKIFFGKFTSYMTFGAHKLVHSEPVGLPIPNLTLAVSTMSRRGEKNLYRCTSTVLALNCCSRIFFKTSAIYAKWCAQTFPPIFFGFSQFLTAISRKLWRHLATKMRTM